ncbi:MAG: ATP-binding cassette domain-containing protein [Deltaproteobacteria bacterium]|nr:ATP-binding cassette domain-containing protein [Deltaproteobacteria bacterium]
MTSYLCISGLTHSFGGPPVLADLDLEITALPDQPAPAVCLMGPNGAGKSTLVGILIGAIRPSPGTTIEILGTDSRGLKPARFATLGVAESRQEARDVNPELTVFTNLCLIPRLAQVPWWRRLLFFRHRCTQVRAFRRCVGEELSELGCQELVRRLDEPAGNLSYGWRKILSILRVHYSDCQLALLDEPYAGLDPSKADLVQSLIETWRAAGRAVLFVEHIRTAAMRRYIEDTASRVTVLQGGRIVLDGLPAGVLSSSSFQAVYLGEMGKSELSGHRQPVGTEDASALEMENVRARYDRRDVLRIERYRQAEGSFVLLVGPNGSGKSTMLGCLHRIGEQVEGTVRLFTERIDGVAAAAVARRAVAFVPQRDRLYDDLSVARNLEIALGSPPARAEREETRLRLEQHFPALAERRDQVAGSLSSGERAQLAVALALARQPRLLVADEISIGLDGLGAKRLLWILGSLRDQGRTVLLAEQSYQAALRQCDRVVALRDGRLEWQAPPCDFSPEVQGALFAGRPLDPSATAEGRQ